MTHTELHAGFLLLIRDLVKAYDDGLPYEDFTEECVKLCNEHTSDLQAKLAAAEAALQRIQVIAKDEWHEDSLENIVDACSQGLAAEPRKEG